MTTPASLAAPSEPSSIAHLPLLLANFISIFEHLEWIANAIKYINVQEIHFDFSPVPGRPVFLYAQNWTC
jgi:hypothetical protein